MNKFVLTVLFIGLNFISFCQKYDIDLELKTKYGFLIAHRAIMSHIPKDHTKAFELNIVVQTNSSKSWHGELKQAKIGFSFVGTSVGNKELMGNLFGSYLFLQFPFIKSKKNFLYGKAGTGIGFAPKVFHQQNDPKNIAISTHINALINFGLFYQHHFKKTYFNVGLDLTHFSNGAAKMPNLGINLPYLACALGYHFQQSKNEINFRDKVPLMKDWNFLVIGIASFKEDYPTNGNKYPIFASSFLGQKLFSHKLGYETGLDFMYKSAINNYKPEIYKPKESLFQIGYYNGYLLTLDRLQVAIGLGIYIKDEYNADNYFYNRLGLRYYLNNKFFINFTLKSHWAKADYIEYGMGIRF